MKHLILFFLFLLTPVSAFSQTATIQDLAVLLNGNWQGGGKGEPGTGTGGFTFAYDLQNKVIVRKSHAVYPAANDHPPITHDDLMTVYADGAEKKLKAIYFDNEGHVINYEIEMSADKTSVVFLSGVIAGQPRYRLSYAKLKDGALNVKFEIAPPGSPDDFKTYLDGKVWKK